ncbi:Ca-activated chloride channel family protein [Sphingopyxis sp. YR583]|uniref:vWA domain-containing protein n=1 Tax=Sphingopyxis sp. YR583 TaxID=1881047 RepID=UPI0008A7B044|nr:VWA domain-containing protein [Sphingopyxis sp. YR583]SEH20427.1 Ca-activated chloride channel family protein [Sphingopyxis sp. YR583]
MPRFCLMLTAGLSITLVTACSQSNEPDIASPSSEASTPAVKADVEEDTSAIVVTSQRIAAPAMDAPMPISVISSESQSAPPAQARKMVVTGSAIRAPYPDRMAPYYQDIGRDKFTSTSQNPFKIARDEPVSTFSIDVDTASYSFVRASLNNNALPQPAAVRTEELINYFPYDYAAPRSSQQPFSSNVAVFPSPFTAGRKLVRIGIKGYEIERATRPRANLVFLIDTSGSMNAPNKLPLVKKSLGLLLDQLDRGDRVSIVTYAGSAGTALEPTAASEKGKILAVIDQLGAGGSTAGAEGIRQAYALAGRNRDPNGVNRVILATDGDFNVGITDQNALKGYIERERGKGIFLSVLGFGMGNYNDALMQTLAQNGNGAAAYIDTLSEARKTLVDEATSTLFPIAKDVKIQVEFNPATVAEYRLIGYETRMLNREDFDNDKVDAGDVGSGQTVTALYEIVPVGGPRTMGDLRYSQPAARAVPTASREYGFVKIRYKLPKSDRSQLISTPIDRRIEFARFADAPQDARFATGVAAFAELMRGGKYSGSMTYDDVLQIVGAARGTDDFGYRMELVQMVRAAKTAGSMARLER